MHKPVEAATFSGFSTTPIGPPGGKAMKTQSFQATLWRPEGRGTTALLHVPLDIPKVPGKLGPAVRVTINGYTYRCTVVVYGGRCYLPVNHEHRIATGIELGDTVTVQVAFETPPPPRFEVPFDIRDALDQDEEASEVFTHLSLHRQREYIAWIESASREETRHRRISQTIYELKQRSLRSSRL
jgi:Bacteriocin-protection, YdeI or OmpD-Associated/Domain of unknown function (DUF1905)